MRAITLVPRMANLARRDDIPEPPVSDGPRLGRLISRRIPLSRWQQSPEWRPDDVKVTIDLTL